MESSKERMQNTEPIIQTLISQLKAMQKKLPCLIPAQPPLHHTSPGGPAQLPAPSLSPVLPLVPITSMSLHPVPALVTGYSDQPGPPPTSCPDRLPPLTSFAPSHLPTWVTSTLAYAPAPPTTCLPPLPLPSIRRPFRLAPLFSHTSPFTPDSPSHPASSPTCQGLGHR